MSIITFKNFYPLNENLKQAKDYITSLINKELVPDTELSDSNSNFHKLKTLLSKNLGYMMFFTKKHYTDSNENSIEKISSVYNKLLQLKHYNINVDLSQFNKKSLDDLDTHLNSLLETRNLPGLVLNSSPVTKKLHSKLANSDWIVVVAVMKDGNKWVRDHRGVLYWGSPSWCIQSRETFRNSYVKSDNYLQYMFIKKNVFQSIKKAATLGVNDTIKLVPNNYEHITASGQSGYNAPFADTSRFGVTTYPQDISEASNIDEYTRKLNNKIYASSDTNGSISLSSINTLLDSFTLADIDIELRNILNLSRSNFDKFDIKFIDLIQHLNININNKSDTALVSNISKFKEVIEKLKNTPFYESEFVPNIIPYIEQHPENFYHMVFMLFHSKLITPSIQNTFISVFDTAAKNLSMSYLLNVLIYYNTVKSNSTINQTLSNLFIKYIVNNYFVNNLLISNKGKDNLNRITDFKTSLLIVYKQDLKFTEYSSLDETVSIHKIVMNVTNNLYMYQSQYGQLILDDEGWEDEYKLILSIYDQISDRLKNNSSDLEKEFDFFFSRHLKNSYNSNVEDFIEKIKHITFTREYNVKLHNQCVLSAFKYYIEEINPSYVSKF